MQIEILKNRAIDFYSGFRKNGHGVGGGGENQNPKKIQV